MQDVAAQNFSIQISDTSKYQSISNSLCSFMMYSDFLEASMSTPSGNSTRLQALSITLQENIKDGCSLLKNHSAISNDVNFTSASPAAGNTSGSARLEVCNSEDLEQLREHCLEQSLLQNNIKAPYTDVLRAVQTDCITDSVSCGWISRHFQEPSERTITVDQANLNCASS